MTEDISTLSKWLNEESTAPIDRQALARVLAIAQQEPGQVFLVATGEIYEGEETYQRFEGGPPPLCDFEVLYTSPLSHSAPSTVDAWIPIESAPENMRECVVVRWTDSDGNEQHEFDYTEDGCWVKWHEHAEHVEMIGGHGVSYTPPYEHYMPLPPAPQTKDHP
jgi:hypothetical protein